MMSITKVRKNFVFNQETNQQLKALTTANNQSATAIVQDLIAQSYQVIAQEKRKQALKSLIGCANGIFSNKSVKKIRVMRIKDKYGV